METPEHYVHGTEPAEQQRLARMNDLLNCRSIDALGLQGGERVLDVGAGLGQLARLMARRVGPRGCVVAVERNAEQIGAWRRLARDEALPDLVDLRPGGAPDLPLTDEENGRFDVAHARFLLEHVSDPEGVVAAMVRAVRPGGRIVLEDDDHEALRLSPALPQVTDLWRAYYLTYLTRGQDPFVGRHLVGLLHAAGAVPRRNDCLFFGSCAGDPDHRTMVDNFIGVMAGARAQILAGGLVDEAEIDEALEAFGEWSRRPDSALWYTRAWAEGLRPD